MRKADEVLAILMADVHLSLKPPVWRSAEPDWLGAQNAVLFEVKQLSIKHKCPIFCAGDIFDRWNSCPELINFAMKFMPQMYAIPGQHDLPNHSYEDIHRSAYQCLANAGIIIDIRPNEPVEKKGIDVYGFPFDHFLIPLKHPNPDKLNVALVHEYKWIPGHSYPNAPTDSRLCAIQKEKIIDNKYMGYDVVVYGDNHKGFKTHIANTAIFNCGTLMRRASDEKDYEPQVGLLMADGSVEAHYLDTSQDKYLPLVETKTENNSNLDMNQFLNELEMLGKTSLDFVETMKEFLHRGKTVNEVKQIILNAMEN